MPRQKRDPTIKAQVADLPGPVRAALGDLTPLQQRFVVYYCGEARGNGVLAAKLAKAAKTYATQASMASQLLRLAKVRVAVEAWLNAFGMSGAEVTARLADLARANLGAFVERGEADGKLVLKTPTADEWDACKHWLKSVDLDEKGNVVRVTLHDSLTALIQLAKILKLYSDAPVFNFNLHLQQLSDEDLLKEYEAVRAGQAPGVTPLRLMSGTNGGNGTGG